MQTRSMPRLAAWPLLFLFVALLGLGSFYQLRGNDMHWVSSEAAVPLGPGAKFVSVKVRGKREFTLSLVFFDTEHYDLRVVDQPNKRRGKQGDGGKSIAQAAAELSGIAGCNGGYFTPSFGPHGLMIADGVVNRTDVVASMGGAGGAVVVRGGKAQIIVDTTFVDGPDVKEFVQCCPLFIVNGKPIADMSGGPSAHRTFILTDNKGHWALGNSTAMGLQELSDALRAPGVITDFKIDMALNLDGGPSTGMWWKDAEGNAHDHPPSWPVRNYLLVTKKPKP